MPKLTQFQALLFDVDRTLVDNNYELPKGLIETLQQFRQKNFTIGICTGRAFQSVQNSILPIFLKIDKEAFHIISGGAEIVNSQGEVFFQQSIPPAVVRRLIKTNQFESRFLASSHFNIYMDDAHLPLYQDKWDRPIKSLSKYEDEPITMINIHDVKPDNQFLSGFKDQLQVKYMVSNDGIDYAEITAFNVNKATGITEWSRLTGVASDKIIGFGDNYNDLEFLQAVGFSVAMGNAVDELKNLADKKIGRVDEDGMNLYLQQVLKTGVL